MRVAPVGKRWGAEVLPPMVTSTAGAPFDVVAPKRMPVPPSQSNDTGIGDWLSQA